jgi:hypothetical protein
LESIISGDWGIKAIDEAAAMKEDKEFQTQLKTISKRLTNFQSTFTASLGDFLLALSMVSQLNNILLHIKRHDIYMLPFN